MPEYPLADLPTAQVVAMAEGETVMEAVASGARVVIQGAEWLARRVDATSTRGYSIHAVGLSERVKNRDAIFL